MSGNGYARGGQNKAYPNPQLVQAALSGPGAEVLRQIAQHPCRAVRK